MSVPSAPITWFPEDEFNGVVLVDIPSGLLDGTLQGRYRYDPDVNVLYIAFNEPNAAAPPSATDVNSLVRSGGVRLMKAAMRTARA